MDTSRLDGVGRRDRTELRDRRVHHAAVRHGAVRQFEPAPVRIDTDLGAGFRRDRESNPREIGEVVSRRRTLLRPQVRVGLVGDDVRQRLAVDAEEGHEQRELVDGHVLEHACAEHHELASNSKKKPPTPSCDGHKLMAWLSTTGRRDRTFRVALEALAQFIGFVRVVVH